MKIPDRCSAVNVVFKDGTKESFAPKGKIDEYEDTYEFEETVDETSQKEGSSGMVVLYKSEMRAVRFVK